MSARRDAGLSCISVSPDGTLSTGADRRRVTTNIAFGEPEQAAYITLSGKGSDCHGWPRPGLALNF
jgi:hypothetical protein